MREYKKCFIAFLDLLGFKNYLLKRDCEEIALVFDKISKQDYFNLQNNGLSQPLVPPNKIDYKVMSDSIIIAIDSSCNNALLAIILKCLYFQMKLLNLADPIFLRGGIVEGDIYCNGDVVFGTGLSNAYLLENNTAKYPRIILPADMVNNYDFSNDEDGKYSMLVNGLLLYKDFDEYYGINYLQPYFTFWHKNGYDDRLKNYIRESTKSDDESIRNKYLYLQNKVDEYCKLGRI